MCHCLWHDDVVPLIDCFGILDIQVPGARHTLLTTLIPYLLLADYELYIKLGPPLARLKKSGEQISAERRLINMTYNDSSNYLTQS
jgi:hypothetical protein